MNYNVLRYFSVLTQVEHYTLAAARLGISQPTLSSAIHNLENELGGVKLFEKSGRNVRLTDEGRFYQEKVSAALQELHSASIVLRNSKVSAPVVIRMGHVSGTLSGLVAQKIAEYTAKNERIRFHLTESSAENLMDMVRQEKLDMAIVDSTDRDRSLHFRKLNQREIYVAFPLNHPLANHSEIEPKDVVHEPQIVFNYNVGKSFKEWATTEIAADIKSMWYRLSRREDDYCIECSEDGVIFRQMRICHMHRGGGTIRFGVYACSPEESSFKAVFTDMEISECKWLAHDGQQPDAD